MLICIAHFAWQGQTQMMPEGHRLYTGEMLQLLGRSLSMKCNAKKSLFSTDAQDFVCSCVFTCMCRVSVCIFFSPVLVHFLSVPEHYFFFYSDFFPLNILWTVPSCGHA